MTEPTILNFVEILSYWDAILVFDGVCNVPMVMILCKFYH